MRRNAVHHFVRILLRIVTCIDSTLEAREFVENEKKMVLKGTGGGV
jgi:hypothetical protein